MCTLHFEKRHTLHTNSDQIWWIQTCQLDAGAFKYDVRGSDTVKGCRRWSGTLTFSDIS